MARPRPNAGFFAAILVVIVLLSAAYMGIYYAMLLRVIAERQEDGTWRPEPRYRMNGENGEKVEKLLTPAHRLDRIIRPNFWRSEDADWPATRSQDKTDLFC